MGLFSSKKKYSVYSSSAKLMEPNPNATKDSVLYAVLKQQSIPNTLVSNNIKAMNIKVSQARKYARNEYALGMPNDIQSASGMVADSVVADVVTQDLGLTYGCVVEANYIAPLTVLSIAAPYLYETRGFSANTSLIDPELRPEDWELPEKYQMYPLEPTITVDDVVLNEDATITIFYDAVLRYSVTSDGGTRIVPYQTDRYTNTYEETIPVAEGFHVGAMYYVAAYKVKDNLGVASDTLSWWYYHMGTGTYPELVNTEGTPEDNNSYPVVPIRYDNKFISAENQPEIYDTGGKLLKILGLNFDQLVTGLDSSEDIDEVDHAYVLFGVDLNTDEPVVLRYLAEFFDYLAATSVVSIWDRMDFLFGRQPDGADKKNSYSFGSYTNSSNSLIRYTSEDNSTTIVGPESVMDLTEHGLQVNINYDQVTSVYEANVIGDVGHAEKEITYGIRSDEESMFLKSNYETVLVIREQVSAGTCRVVTVRNLQHTNMIYERKKKAIYTDPKDILDDENNHNLIIPLHYAVVKRLPRQEQNTIYEHSLHLVMNSLLITKEEWYERGLFKGIVAIVGIIITVWTGQAWVLELVAAIEAGIAAVIWFVLEAAIYSLAVGYAAQLVISIVGPEIGFLVAALAAAYGFRASLTGGMGTFNIVGQTLPTAEALISAGLSVMRAAGDAYQDIINDVISEYDDWKVTATEKQQMLEDRWQLLESTNLLPFSWLDVSFSHPVPDTTTKADQFFNPIHIGNPGTLSLDVVSNYHSMALLLPDAAYNTYERN